MNCKEYYEKCKENTSDDSKIDEVKKFWRVARNFSADKVNICKFFDFLTEVYVYCSHPDTIKSIKLHINQSIIPLKLKTIDFDQFCDLSKHHDLEENCLPEPLPLTMMNFCDGTICVERDKNHQTVYKGDLSYHQSPIYYIILIYDFASIVPEKELTWQSYEIKNGFMGLDS